MLRSSLEAPQTTQEDLIMLQMIESNHTENIHLKGKWIFFCSTNQIIQWLNHYLTGLFIMSSIQLFSFIKMHFISQTFEPSLSFSKLSYPSFPPKLGFLNYSY